MSFRALERTFEAVLNWDAATANSVADKNADPEALPMFDVRTMDTKDFEKLLLSVFCWAYVTALASTISGSSHRKHVGVYMFTSLPMYSNRKRIRHSM